MGVRIVNQKTRASTKKVGSVKPNSYITFFKSFRKEFVSGNTGADFLSIGKAAGEKWRSLSVDERKTYLPSDIVVLPPPSPVLEIPEEVVDEKPLVDTTKVDVDVVIPETLNTEPVSIP